VGGGRWATPGRGAVRCAIRTRKRGHSIISNRQRRGKKARNVRRVKVGIEPRTFRVPSPARCQLRLVPCDSDNPGSRGPLEGGSGRQGGEGLSIRVAATTADQVRVVATTADPVRVAAIRCLLLLDCLIFCLSLSPLCARATGEREWGRSPAEVGGGCWATPERGAMRCGPTARAARFGFFWALGFF
jgi:hypothetical protein